MHSGQKKSAKKPDLTEEFIQQIADFEYVAEKKEFT